jgi:hypothetical protein
VIVYTYYCQVDLIFVNFTVVELTLHNTNESCTDALPILFLQTSKVTSRYKD